MMLLLPHHNPPLVDYGIHTFYVSLEDLRGIDIVIAYDLKDCANKRYDIADGLIHGLLIINISHSKELLHHVSVGMNDSIILHNSH